MLRRLAVKGYHFDVAGFVSLEEQRKSLQQKTEDLQNERNVKSKSIGQAKAAGEDIAPLLAEVGDLGERLDQSKAAFAEVQEAMQTLLMSLPNMPHRERPGRKRRDVITSCAAPGVAPSNVGCSSRWIMLILQTGADWILKPRPK